MSNQMLEVVKTTKVDTVIVAGRFVGGASSATTVTEGAPDFTVAGAGSGVYTITFAKNYKKLVACALQIGATTAADVDTYVVVRGTFTAAPASGGSTLVITTSEGGTPTDIAALEFVDFIAVLRETDL